MQKFNIIEKISNKERYLIDYANLINQDLFYQNKFFKKKLELKKFLKDPTNGIPVIFPENLDYFFYSKCERDKFSINENFYLKYLFRLKRKDYIPEQILKEFGLSFSKVTNLKSKNSKRKVKEIILFNNVAKKKIKKLKNKFKRICAFQTRNIPHLGHEEIIKKLLLKFDHVVINPVLGPKKEGDINYKLLYSAFNFLIKKKYKKKSKFYSYYCKYVLCWPIRSLTSCKFKKIFWL